jgi:threonine dehydrogenase-like Zn-dependent dehydrogenase
MSEPPGSSCPVGVTTVLTGPGEVEQRQYPLADPPAGGVLVGMLRANVCGSELHILRGGHPLIRPGCTLGHEGVGRVARLGAGVTADSAGATLREGDRVVASYFGACRRCPECNRGDLHLCRHGYAGWATPADRAPHFYGTFGTHWVLTADQAVYRVPESVSTRAASVANCALAQMVAATHRGDVRWGDRVLILGAGGLGLCGAALASQSGAEVTIADVVPGRLARAARFGAARCVDLSGAPDSASRVDALLAATSGGADVVIEVTGVPTAFVEGLRAVRPGGCFIGVGNITPNRLVEFDPGLFTRSGATVRAVIR